jgi:hypothetical protein
MYIFSLYLSIILLYYIFGAILKWMNFFFLAVPVDPSIYPDYVQYQKSNFRIFRPSERQGLFT